MMHYGSTIYHTAMQIYYTILRKLFLDLCLAFTCPVIGPSHDVKCQHTKSLETTHNNNYYYCYVKHPSDVIV